MVNKSEKRTSNVLQFGLLSRQQHTSPWVCTQHSWVWNLWIYTYKQIKIDFFSLVSTLCGGWGDHVSMGSLWAVTEFNCMMTVNKVSTRLTYSGIDKQLFDGDILIWVNTAKLRRNVFCTRCERLLLNKDIWIYNWILSIFLYINTNLDVCWIKAYVIHWTDKKSSLKIVGMHVDMLQY